MTDYSPIILFCYKRLASTIQTVESLRNNKLAKDSVLYIYSDGPKNSEEEEAVTQIRKYLKSIAGFKGVFIIESPENKGLAASIIQGVTKVINEHGKAIVLEDDLVLAANFLFFMNTALWKYERTPAVHSISGFIFDIDPGPDYPYDVFFTKRHCSWGWALWKDRWNEIDWEVKDFPEFNRSVSEKRAFNHIGSDLTAMLNKQMNGRIDSWAIRCIYHQFKKETYTAYPLKSKVINKGFGKDATHTNMHFNRYKATLDKEEKYEFAFPDYVFEDGNLLKKFKKKYSKITRLYYYGLNKILRYAVL